MNKILALKDMSYKLLDPQCIILDKDGTIIDVHHYWAKMTSLRINLILDSYDLPAELQIKISRSLKRSLGINHRNKVSPEGPAGVLPRHKINDTFKESLLDFDIKSTTKEIDLIFEKADELSKKNIGSFLRVLPGVDKLIMDCNKHKVDLALISNDIASRLELTMRSLGYLDYFKYIIGQDCYKSPKPSKIMAEKVIQKGGYDSGKMASIGDHPNDIKMAFDARINGNIAVLSGLSKKEDFLDEKCIVIKSLKQLELSIDE